MKIHRTNPLSWLLLLCLVLSPNLTAETREAQSDLYTIKVGIDLWPGYYPIVLAKELGYFKKHGLNVDYYLPENTDSMLNEFSEGKLEVSQPREPPPRLLSEPSVNLSAHWAPIIQPSA